MTMPADQKRKLRRTDRVELRFLERVRERCPGDAKILRALGDLYTRVGCFQEGLEVDLRLAELCPGESEVWYNLGCSYALVGDHDKALDVLGRAVDLGYRDYQWMGQDKDLAALRKDARFDRLFYRMIAALQEDSRPQGGGPT